MTETPVPRRVWLLIAGCALAGGAAALWPGGSHLLDVLFVALVLPALALRCGLSARLSALAGHRLLAALWAATATGLLLIVAARLPALIPG